MNQRIVLYTGQEQLDSAGNRLSLVFIFPSSRQFRKFCDDERLHPVLSLLFLGDSFPVFPFHHTCNISMMAGDTENFVLLVKQDRRTRLFCLT